jgi:tetratricopeptide (TPR) repeat protein
MKLQAMDSEEPGATPKPPARPKAGELVFLDTGSDSGPSEAKRPAAGQGRRTPSRGNEPTTRVLERSPGLEIIDVPSLDDEVEIAAEAAHQRESLQIETSNISDAPLDLESVQPISDEASIDMTHLEVAQTLGFEPTVTDEPSESDVKPLDGLEIDEPLPDRVDLEAAPDLGIERASDLSAEAEEIDRVAALSDAAATDDTPDLSDELAVDLEDLPQSAGAAEAVEEGLGLDLIDPDEALTPVLTDDTPGSEVLYIEEDEPEPEAEVEAAVPVAEIYQPTVADLEDRVLEDPDSPEPHRALGEALLAEGEAMRGQEELELALSAYENREDWDHASSLVNELIRLDPNGVRYHQKRVELAFRGGDRARLLGAYVELGDALMRVGAADKAVAVYRRVAEHDPSNARAQAALDSMTPVEEIEIPLAADQEPEPQAESPAPTGKGERAAPKLSGPMFAPSGDFIDLGALVLDDDRPRDARMRVEDEEPTGDEQKDFDEMLTQFKRGIDENLGDEDFEAHYDLGVAFREMGLLDEAIAEFQKALRAPENRLKTSEALGTSFYDKGQFAIAESILRRAVESLGASDERQIGLLYWLARSREALGKIDAALPCYERVVAVDIGFQDAGDRMTKLTAERP